MADSKRLGLTSDLLQRAGFRHAFFMRNGGVSPAPWHSLNFSTASGDSPASVERNLELAAAEVDVALDEIYYLSQVHGCDARLIEKGDDRRRVLLERGDITLSKVPGIGCGVRTADCVAILLADPRSGAVAAIHSGWRGTVRGAVAHGVRALRELAGAGELLAAVGPHIERCCFEVGKDVAEQLAAASEARNVVHTSRCDEPSGEEPQGSDEPSGEEPGSSDEPSGEEPGGSDEPSGEEPGGSDEPSGEEPGGRVHVDLRAVIHAQLAAEGVGQIDHVYGCTVCDPARFHSYRRDGAVSGRMLALVTAR